jgi:hypothetical protein
MKKIVPPKINTCTFIEPSNSWIVFIFIVLNFIVAVLLINHQIISVFMINEKQNMFNRIYK